MDKKFYHCIFLRNIFIFQGIKGNITIKKYGIHEEIYSSFSWTTPFFPVEKNVNKMWICSQLFISFEIRDRLFFEK